MADASPRGEPKEKEFDDPRLAGFLSPLDGHQRSIFMLAIRRWREHGGKVAMVGRGVALQALQDERLLALLWAFGADSGPQGPRFEVPLAALARRGVSKDLLDQWKDDLTTVARTRRGVDVATIAVKVDEAFGAANALKLVDSALALSRRL